MAKDTRSAWAKKAGAAKNTAKASAGIDTAKKIPKPKKSKS